VSVKSVQVKKNETSGPTAVIQKGRVNIVLLGTAHVSPESVEDVEKLTSKLDPDIICVELCRPRYDALLDPDRWRKLDITKVIREKKMGLLFSSLILSAYQKKLGLEKGVKPGQEMLRGVELAEANGKELVLADRPVSTTLTRAWRKVGFWSKAMIASQLASSVIVREEVTPEEIEKLKSEDAIADLFKSLPRQFRSVQKILIGERDEYLAEKVRQAAAKISKGTVLVVIGAGHLEGVKRVLEEDTAVDLRALDEIPPAKPIRTIVTWVIASVVIGFLLYRFGEKDITQTLIAWVIGRSAGAGIGAILSLAHPLTILVTMIMAPVSFFIPGTRLWMYSTLTQAWVRKPHVHDFEDIAESTSDTKGLFKALYRNRVLHLFWTMTLVSLGLTAGNLYVAKVVAALVAGN
jgi:pheromone shutdown-related protein TraB